MLAKEFWPLRVASPWWLPQLSAASGLGLCKMRAPGVVAAWGLGGPLPSAGRESWPWLAGKETFLMNEDHQNLAAFKDLSR